MNINNRSQDHAVKLYVYIDRLDKKSEYPLLVIINRYKLIADLRREFSNNHHIDSDDQYWVINNKCFSDDTDIGSAIKEANPFQKGYLAYLFVIKRADINKIPRFIDVYLEEKYAREVVNNREKEVLDDPIIIADSVNTRKPLPFVGWTCEACTMANKAYKEWCDVCGFSRPTNYKIPVDYIWTKEGTEYMRQLDEENQKQIKLANENLKKMELERDAYRKKLETMSKEEVSFTSSESECPICVMDYPAGESIILHSCLHTVCKDCLKAYLATVVDPKVNCPTENCVGIIEDREIKATLTEKEYLKYEQLSLRTAESKAGNTFHCKTPNCTAWVVYDDDVNFFDCPLCVKQNCLLCKAIHEKQNCKEFQEELKIKALNDEAARKDLEFLENMIKNGEAMNCPTCKIMIQKKEGCDWMMCNMCKTELCWATKGPRWGPKGPGDNTGGCMCRVNGKRCHPKCGNCH